MSKLNILITTTAVLVIFFSFFLATPVEISAYACKSIPDGSKEHCAESGPCQEGYYNPSGFWDRNECGSCGSIKKDCYNGTKSCNCPEDAKALIEGRIFKYNAQCENGNNYYGAGCKTGNCNTGPGFTVTYTRDQTGESKSIGNSCDSFNALYTFGDSSPRDIPVDGLPVTLQVAVDPTAGDEWGLVAWSHSVGTTPVASGIFANKAKTQEIKTRVFAGTNHIWFWSFDTVKIAGCFYDKQTGRKITELLPNASYPKVTIATSDLQQREAQDIGSGCFELSNFVPEYLAYAVRPAPDPVPSTFKAPAFVSNLNAFVHWKPDGSNEPIGPIPANWTSYEAQNPGQSDCGENCSFAYEPEVPIPDCTNLSGPNRLSPGQTATYQLTADASRAPVTAVGLESYGASCADPVTQNQLTPVTGAGTYDFSWTAPNAPGAYTLYGRVANGTTSECTADCSSGAPQYTCGSAALCKMTVYVANKPTGEYSVACTDNTTPLAYTHTVSNIDNSGVGDFMWSNVYLSFYGNNRNPEIRAFLGEPTWENDNWYGYLLHQFSSWQGTGPLSVQLTAATQIGATGKTIEDLANKTKELIDAGELPHTYKYSVTANLAMAGHQTDDLGGKQIELLPTSCADLTNQTITIKGTVREGKVTKLGLHQYCAADDPNNPTHPAVGLQGTVELYGTSMNTQNLNGGSTFSFTLDPTQLNPRSTLRLKDFAASGYTCSCEGTAVNTSCTYSIPTSIPGTYTYDFFVSKFNETSWWQVAGGSIFGQGNIASAIPATCIGTTCNPHIIAKELYPDGVTPSELSAGVPIATGTISSGTGNTSDRQSSTTNIRLNHLPTIQKQNYAYFAEKIGLESIAETPGTTVRKLADIITTPVGEQLVSNYSGTLVIAPDSTWQVGDTATPVKHIIFADEVILDDPDGIAQLTSVPEGSIFLVIAKNITFSENVGDIPTNGTVNVDGIFIADNELKVAADNNLTTADKRFIGRGSFTGWGSVTLERKYTDGGAAAQANDLYPAEQFIFRPDFVKNFPGPLKDVSTVWQEIN